MHFAAAVVVAAAAASTAAATAAAAAAAAALQHLRSCLGLRNSQRSLNSLHSGTVDAAAVAAAAAGFCRLGGREVRRREDADCVLMAFYAH